MVLGPGVQIGSGAQLTQYQFFVKTDPNASLTVVVTQAFLEAIDENGGFPTALECPWHRPGSNFSVDCRHVMWAWVNFHLEAVSFRTNSTLLRTGGFAEVSGFRGDFRYDAYTEGGSTRSFWKFDDFAFNPDFDETGGGHATLELAHEIAIEIPLTAVEVGETFSVVAAAEAKSLNHRQRESFLAAYFRDPQNANGLQWRYSGLKPVETPATQADPLHPPARGGLPDGTRPRGRAARLRVRDLRRAGARR